MLKLLKIQDSGPGERRVKWSVNYERMLKRHELSEFGNLSAFLRQNQLVLEAVAVKANFQSSRKPSSAFF